MTIGIDGVIGMAVGSATITAGARTLPVIKAGTEIGIETTDAIVRVPETEATAAAPALLAATEVTLRVMRTEIRKGTGATTDGATTTGRNRNESVGIGA